MKIAITIQHPAHVHFFRNAIETFRSDGHSVSVVARRKDVTADLLDHYSIEHEMVCGAADSLPEMIGLQIKYEIALLGHALSATPDVMVAIGEPGVAHVSSVTSTDSVVFTDTEQAKLQNMIGLPFATRVCTPECYVGDYGRKHVRYPGYHELAYLHPDRFEPDPAPLVQEGIDPDETIAAIRLSSWQAAHDVGRRGVSDLETLVSRLIDAGVRPVVSDENHQRGALSQYAVPFEPHEIHHLLHYADVYLGEGATMAAEAAVLGTPSIYMSPLMRGYIDELSDEYGLAWQIEDPDTAIETAIDLAGREPGVFEKRRAEMLRDKTDTTDVIVDQVYDVAE